VLLVVLCVEVVGLVVCFFCLLLGFLVGLVVYFLYGVVFLFAN